MTRLTRSLSIWSTTQLSIQNSGGQVVLWSEVRTSTILIHVSDQGIGIAAENQAKIFNRFYQVDRSRTSGARKSAGLGLPIARQIARAHGGEILVSSDPGGGTTFTVRAAFLDYQVKYC